jgi:hypothetical protein
MATQTVSQLSPVVPFQAPASEAKPVVIAQDTLTHYKALLQRIEALRAESDQIATEIGASLRSGAVIEPGLLRAFLKTNERRNVSWKAVVERELGEGYAKRVLASTKPDPITSLIVEV